MNLTPEDVIELGKQVEEIWLASLTVDDVFAHFGREKILSYLLKRNPAEVLDYLGLEGVLLYLKPKEVLPYLKPEEVLAGLEPEIIEDYLKQLKKQQH